MKCSLSFISIFQDLILFPYFFWAFSFLFLFFSPKPPPLLRAKFCSFPFLLGIKYWSISAYGMLIILVFSWKPMNFKRKDALWKVVSSLSFSISTLFYLGYPCSFLGFFFFFLLHFCFGLMLDTGVYCLIFFLVFVVEGTDNLLGRWALLEFLL